MRPNKFVLNNISFAYLTIKDEFKCKMATKYTKLLPAEIVLHVDYENFIYLNTLLFIIRNINV